MHFVVIQTILLTVLLAAYALPIGPMIADPPAWIGHIGKGLVWTGLCLAAVAIVSLGRATRVSPEPGGSQLVERGVYRFMRHPMYTSAAVVSIGMALSTLRLTVVLSAIAVFVFYLIKSRYEEQLLIAHFPEYEAYRRRTLGVLLTKGASLQQQDQNSDFLDK